MGGGCSACKLYYSKAILDIKFVMQALNQTEAQRTKPFSQAHMLYLSKSKISTQTVHTKSKKQVGFPTQVRGVFHLLC